MFTGEYVIKGEADSENSEEVSDSVDLTLEDLALPLPEFFLDEALRLIDLEDETSQVRKEIFQIPSLISTQINRSGYI